MTDSEALEIGRKLHKNIMIGDNNIVTRFDYFKYVEVANVALEKQIPKKPIIIFEHTHDCVTEFEYECPICGNIYIELAPCNEWCSNCGNKFDWSDEEYK